MQIHIARNGQQLGPYPIEEINRKLADGTLSLTDQAWHEGAAGWAPLSTISGVTIPGRSPAPSTPVTPPIYSQAPVSAAQPAQSSTATGAFEPARSYNVLAIVSWVLLGSTLLMSFVPVLGCGSWLLVWPVALATFIMAIIVLTRGGKAQGILLILASILIVPLALIAPIITTAALGISVDKEQKKHEVQIAENLRALDDAKTQWTVTTNAAPGAPVALANLSSALAGREVKPAVGETYDPMPVGQEPRATLPATKSLGAHKGGSVLTLTILTASLSFPSPTASPAPAATVAPAATIPPAMTPATSSPPPHPVVPEPTATPEDEEEEEE